MTLYEISEMIVSGFEKLVIRPGESASKYDARKGCDDMLLAWDGLKLFMDENNISDIWELERKQIREFREYNIHPSFLFQILADELHNAGLEDKAYFEKRIEYCTDLLKYVGDDRLTIENTRRGIADSYFELGDEAECDRLYSEWLETDPEWGLGYVWWASNYEFGRNERRNTGKAMRLYETALGIDGIRGRKDIIERALQFYEEIGNNDRIDELRNELSKLQAASNKRTAGYGRKSASSRKIGRNEPCPCGSGKKFKKCCGA